MSQAAYGSRGTYAASDNSAVTWSVKNWIVIEWYDASGYCDEVTYTARDGSAPTDAEILGILRVNTPRGVVWREKSPPPVSVGMEWFRQRKWYSSEYSNNGLIAESLVATLYCDLIDTGEVKHDPNGDVVHISRASYSFRISTASANHRIQLPMIRFSPP
jgi:hypothetical protein